MTEILEKVADPSNWRRFTIWQEGDAEVNEYMTLKEHYDLVKKKQEDERYVGLAHDLFRMIEKSRFTIPRRVSRKPVAIRNRLQS